MHFCLLKILEESSYVLLIIVSSETQYPKELGSFSCSVLYNILHSFGDSGHMCMLLCTRYFFTFCTCQTSMEFDSYYLVNFLRFNIHTTKCVRFKYIRQWAFNRHVHLYNHYHSQYRENVPSCPFAVGPLYPQPRTAILLSNIVYLLPFLECHINRTTWYVLLCLGLLYLP